MTETMIRMVLKTMKEFILKDKINYYNEITNTAPLLREFSFVPLLIQQHYVKRELFLIKSVYLELFRIKKLNTKWIEEILLKMHHWLA